MSRMSVRGFAVASATAVTTVGAAVGVASGDDLGGVDTLEAIAADTSTLTADASLLVDIPAADTRVQAASLTRQAEFQGEAAQSATKRAAEEAARLKAAEDAAAKREAAEREAREKAEREAQEKAEREAREKAEREAAEVASASTAQNAASAPVQASYTKSEIQAMAMEIVGAGQYQCFSNIIERESGWNHTATNPSSGAYGLVQALPAGKMASAGADWRTNPATQIKWGLNYMNERYGSPCGAWEFWQANHWY
ncbi:transglycosylase SLT domain-containing protein [Streptomyces alkaliphilus]|uniref:Transglycosylase SLT domain-containing protein n=1 Tax=Streptomyces alkaliphilus TaxID=1472722 RepID=A0A7W3TAR3_9ACTN|nr:transglycosylase SLT domain-containing protein [Streptomyces alkaliphilus]MQS08224.1 transglycosylase SLT domain-containing protein [Streptomyces alkaliphilus]